MTIAAGEREALERPARVEPVHALVQIFCQRAGVLVAILGVLGQQLHHQVRDQERQPRAPGVRRLGPADEVAVEQLHHVVGHEGQGAREELVEHDAERVEIAAAIDDPIHATGLLGREIGERALERARAGHQRGLVRQTQGPTKPDEVGSPSLDVDQDVVGVDVFVDDAPRVDLRERDRERGGNLQRQSERHRARSQQAAQGNAAGVGPHEHEPVAQLFEADWGENARDPELLFDRVFVAESSELRRARVLVDEHLDEHGQKIVVSMAAVEIAVPVTAKRVDQRVLVDPEHQRQCTGSPVAPHLKLDCAAARRGAMMRARIVPNSWFSSDKEQPCPNTNSCTSPREGAPSKSV